MPDFNPYMLWRNPQTATSPRLDQILLVAAKRTPDLAQRLSTVIDAARPVPSAIGRPDHRGSCAAFQKPFQSMTRPVSAPLPDVRDLDR
jgi:hypothetical protein